MPELVKQHGVSLVVLGDTVAAPEISELAGVRYISDFVSRDTLAAAGEHFITRGLNGGEKSFMGPDQYWPGNKVVSQGAAVLISRGPHPFLTARQWDGGGRPILARSHFFRPQGSVMLRVVW